ncbi:MAG: radical SAM protein [Deltaproteobacteria bacterium]|jgi:radical SAM superfamily enzyme YgiQ (UPF0313 family)|nr:radical SAM protein [Deltaproteobacteria bacterium]
MSRGQVKKAQDSRLSQEKGRQTKEPGGRIRVGLIWPGSYETGMSSLGFLTVYSLLNALPWVFAERIFAEKTFSEKTGSKHPGNKSLSLETKTFLSEFDLLAASLTLENDYWILLDILAKGQIKPERTARDREPLVFVGGVGVWANPWPLIPFADLFLLGEAEIQWPQIMEYYLDPFFAVATKEEKLKLLVEKIPGALAPSLWPVEVLNGEVALANPIRPARVCWPPLDQTPPRSPIITPNTEFGERRLVEISRGCPHGCRFCLAGSLYRPHRPWPLEQILGVLGQPQSLGEAVGLVSPAVADHPEIDTLLDVLKEQGRAVSVSSLRLSALTENLARRLLASGVKGLAVAPEAGTQRLRDVINKVISEEEILGACRLLAEAGLRKLKLYFMVGLPGETDEDLASLALLCQKIQKSVRAKSFAPKLVVSVANFCPKPQTPFESEPLLSEAELIRKAQVVKKSLAKVGGLELRLDPPLWSIVQSLLARGGAESGDLVRALWLEGGKIKPAYRKFKTQMEGKDKFTDQVLGKAWPSGKYKPWRVVEVAAGSAHWATEKERSQRAQTSSPCPVELGCGRCGACEKN